MPTALSPIEANAARLDPDRWAAALAAPASVRADLAALIVFASEVGKTREAVSEPMLGTIRLQWWRESLEGIFGGGPVRAHETVEALAPVIARHGLDCALFDAMIDARESDLEPQPFETWEDLEGWLDATAGNLIRLGVAVCGGANPMTNDLTRAAGCAWGLAGLMRALPFWSSRRQLWLPRQATGSAGLDTEATFAGRLTPALTNLLGEAARRARQHQADASRLAPSAPADVWPAISYVALAPAYASRTQRLADPFREAAVITPAERTLRLFWATLTGRL